MDNQTQPIQENLTTFTQNMLTHAIQPLSRGEQALAATLTTNASAEEEKLAQEYLLHQILAANLFASEQEAQAYSNNLLQNMKREGTGKSLQQMMAAAAFLGAQSAQKKGTESYELHLPVQPVPQPQFGGAAMHARGADPLFPREQKMQQQPQEQKEEIMPGKDKTKLPGDAFNVQDAKKKTEDRRSGGASGQPGQSGKPGEQQEAQNQQQQNQPQRRQEETQTTQPQQKKGGGLFKKVFIGAGGGALLAGGIGGLTIFNAIQ